MFKISKKNKLEKVVRQVLALFFVGISILSIIAPAWQEFFGYPHGESIYSLFSPICHQYPTRCLWWFNRPAALCSRCFSGYLGTGIGFWILNNFPKYWKRLLLGFLLLSPGVADGLVQLLTSYESTNLIRVITGISGGIGIAFIIYPITYITKKGGAK